ncbi:hypothetical protein SUDANB176_05538 [Streptomyces sp. enrichment culture]|uniref:restriction endonuclease subunit S n=1 Tax=Streptomyces sp. enrichment culture TaxID=1795815 RepID=UPI003F547FC0
MSEWVNTTLGEFVGLQRGHDLPSGQRVSGPVPVVGSGGVTGWHNESKASGPGITIGRAANLGVPTLVEQDFWPLNTTLYVTDFRGNNVRFTYHLFQVLDLAGFNSGSVQPMLNRNYISSFPIVVPKRPEQDAIAAVLGALDDKIAVNERIADTSEKLALNLASPVRWQARARVEEVCVLRREQVSPRDVSEELVDHYSLPAFDAGRTPERVAPEAIKSGKFSVTEPAVLLSKLNPEIPRAWDVTPDSSGPSLASTEFLVLVPRGTLTSHELWAVVRQQAFFDDLASRVTGTSKSHQRVRPAEVMATEIVDPRQFGEAGGQIRNLCATAALARHESQTLAALRDTLLPQLMSGRLRVKDAEKIVEDAT